MARKFSSAAGTAGFFLVDLAGDFFIIRAPKVPGDAEEFQTKSDSLQAKNQNFSEFFLRTNALAAKMGLNLSELPEILGFSKPMLFAYRSGKNPISPKAWAKLEKAEAAAGLILTNNAAESSQPQIVVRSNDPKQSAGADDHFVDPNKLILDGETTALLRRIADALETIASHLVRETR